MKARLPSPPPGQTTQGTVDEPWALSPTGDSTYMETKAEEEDATSCREKNSRGNGFPKGK